jgi:hypothetical protein
MLCCLFATVPAVIDTTSTQPLKTLPDSMKQFKAASSPNDPPIITA